ncbi:DUF3231 family protein [Metabacillus sp. cB07]|uniref:DUF3231 family protein n=1 Tax=Metabacillus sp. cB07 TaxID=2806989 RepID=UPI00193A4EF9|nr:DUF3231 family protein [Metabacillus sp. cB07]
MAHHNINLTAPEISALWTTYMQESASLCFLKHFMVHMEDEEIAPLVKEAMQLSASNLETVKRFLEGENYPVPDGFSDADVDLSAPPLYTDLYALSYVYRTSQLTLVSVSTLITNVARTDLLAFFIQVQQKVTGLYKMSVDLMLSKGIYDRPPKMTYPDSVHYVENNSYLTGWFGERRPLNSYELGEAFFIIERNYIGILLLKGFLQSMKDKEVKNYLLRAKKLAEKQVDVFNLLLKKEGHLGTIPVSLEVTDSEVCPFSEKLIMFMITASTGAAISLIGRSLSLSMRRDVAAHYLLIMKDIMLFTEDGTQLMIRRGWFEQPPQSEIKPL